MSNTTRAREWGTGGASKGTPEEKGKDVSGCGIRQAFARATNRRPGRVNQNIRRAIPLLVLLSGCEPGKTVAPDEPTSPAGTWSGPVGSQVLTLTMVESGGVVTGTGTLTNTPTGTRALVVNGTFIKPTLTLTLSSGTTQPFSLEARLVGKVLDGTLNGSGFTANHINLDLKP